MLVYAWLALVALKLVENWRWPGALLALGLASLTQNPWAVAGVGVLLLSSSLRFLWQRLGLPLPPVWLGLVLGVSLGLGLSTKQPLWWLLPLLFRSAPPRPSEVLTPGQATLLLRLPLVVVNACLDRIPIDLQRRWFRPDPMRLHLREPLLEAASAPAYYAALAGHLNERYRAGIDGEEQLVNFCLRHPGKVATALLELPLESAPSTPENWCNLNLSTLRKPGKATMLRHLLLLRRI